MQRFPLIKLVLGTAICALLAFPAFAGDSSFMVAAAKGKKTQAAPAASAGDIQAQLDTFAKNYLKNMNDCVSPSKKKQKSGHGGTYYLEYDPNSIRTSYKPSSNPAVQYIGYLHYDEVTYVCKGNDCKPASRNKLTELIMYVKGKWTY